MARRRYSYCVYTVPPGQTPAKRLKCFRTKEGARRFKRRFTYAQIITETR
jgi:hypothetical protein